MNWRRKSKSDWGRLDLNFKNLSEVSDYVNERVKVENLTVENYISTENMLPNKGGIDKAIKLPAAKTTSLYSKGDILLSNIRTYFKKIWYAEKDGGCSNDVLVVRARGEIEPKFLYYVLSNDKFFEYSSATSKGTKMPRGDKSAIMQYQIPDMPLEEQRTIVSVLSALDDRIAENKKINHHLLAQSRALYRNVLETSETKLVALNHIADIVMGQSPRGDTYNESGIGLPLLNGAADFRGGINPSKWTSDPKKVVHPGSYIFGVRATIGLTTKIFDNYAIGRGTGSATAIESIYEEFLYFALENLFEFFSNSGSGTVYVNISKSEFETYEVELPHDDKIQEYHRNVKSIMDLVYNNDAEISRLQTLRDTLLPKLISGEISVTDQAAK